MNKALLVLIVDDHTLFRESIARLLEQEAGMTIAGICGSVAEARQMLQGTAIDVVLLDYDLGGELGTELLETVAKEHPSTRVLIVTGGMSASVTRRSAQAGVAGMILKHSSPQELMEAVRQVGRGGTWWDQTVIAALASPLPEPAALSDRQRRILNLLLDGRSNKELADELQISESAVKASLQELFRKTGVRTRSQLVRIAIESNVGGAMPLRRSHNL